MIGTVKGTTRVIKQVAGLPAPIASFTTNTKNIIPELDVAVVPVQASGTPTPSSPLPISGWNGAVINRLGKNLIKTTAVTQTIGGVTFTINEDGSVTVNGSHTSRIIFTVGTFIAPSNVSLKYGGATGGSSSTYSVNVGVSGTYKADVYNGVSSAYSFNKGDVVEFVIVVRANYTMNNITFKPLLILSDEANYDFAPYIGNPYTSYFEGLLNGTYGFVDMGSLTWTYTSLSGTYYFQCVGLTSKKVGSVNMVCTNYPTKPTTGISGASDKTIVASGNSVGIFVLDSDYTDATTFTNAMRGVYLIYELATPTTPTITQEQMNTLMSAFGIENDSVIVVFDDTYYLAEIVDKNGVATLRVLGSMYDGSTFISPQNNNTNDGTVCFILASNTDFLPPKEYYMSNALQESNQDWNNLPPCSVSVANNSYIVVCSDTPNQTLTDFKTWFSNNIQLLLKLRTPIEIPLTGDFSLKALNGANNVFADTGNINDLKYNKRVDTSLVCRG